MNVYGLFRVSLNFSILMLSTENDGGRPPGPTLVVVRPIDMTEPQQLLWLDQPYSSYYDYKTNLSSSYQGTLKKQGLLLLSSKRYKACLRAHSEFVKREGGREREQMHGPGVLTLLELRVGCPGFSSFTLYP